MIRTIIANTNLSIISSIISISTDSTGNIYADNLLYQDNDGLVNALYQDSDGIGKALFEEIV